MTIKYSFSMWNGLITKKSYHRKPRVYEVNHANALKKYITVDNLIIFGWGNGVEVRSRIDNSLTSNRYSDVYSVIK